MSQFKWTSLNFNSVFDQWNLKIICCYYHGEFHPCFSLLFLGTMCTLASAPASCPARARIQDRPQHAFFVFVFTTETCSFNYFSTTIRCVGVFYNETFWQRSTIATHNSDDSSQFASLNKTSQGPGTDIANASLIVINCTSALLTHQNLSLKRPKAMAFMSLCIMYVTRVK